MKTMLKQKILLLLSLAIISVSSTKLVFRPHSEEVSKGKLSLKIDCPDKSKCKDNSTCCEVPSGKYACCDLPEAVCCADKMHCCPKQSVCDVEHNRCIRSDGLLTNWHRHEEEAEEEVVNKMRLIKSQVQLCPDNASFCSDEETCCLLPGGMYGCCPETKGVCCEDKEHCCPMGTICNVSHSSCDHSSPDVMKVPWFEKKPALDFKNGEKRVVCPDKASYCNDGQTCCLLSNGKYGCCPYPRAVCCSDKVHCCPNGYMCNDGGRLCTKGSVAVPSSGKLESSNLSLTVCPDGRTSCGSGQTCCVTFDGSYSCCPFPMATCCSDMLHCCPYGFRCDSTGQFCHKGSTTMPSSAKLESTKLSVKENRVVCPDQTSYCEDGQTCCLLLNGRYGCCPYPMAECCSDKTHCCPSGFTCDASGQFCNKGSLTMPSSAKLESTKLSVKENRVVCPDQTSYCEDGQTCCLLLNGRYGCCPYPRAECCSDKTHCCPSGYTCDASGQFCNKGSLTVPSSAKLESTKLSVKENRVVCPGQTSYCEDGQTCCLQLNERYGCCPHPMAECCSDKLHCCPSGYTCDATGQFCNKGSLTVPSSAKLESTKLSVKENRVVCPDQTSYCEDGQTCCLLLNGRYGCCPYQRAECCSDKTHCCPSGYTCDASGQFCNKGSLTMPSSAKLESTKLSVKENRVVCPDQTSYCEDGQTCCLLLNGRYGCCPYPRAECCSDKTHCCPSGYTCDASGQFCNKGSLTMPSSAKLESTKLSAKENRVVCPDQTSYCEDGQTCCLLLNGRYGCCPYPRAECCSDKTHCCPSGYTCDASGQFCNKGSLTVPSSAKLESTKLSVKENKVVCPGQTSYCKDGQTCCLQLSGRYGCCPHPMAVCCSDYIHCCANGYTCDATGQFCNKGSLIVPSSAKLESTKLSVKENRVVCPDQTSYCQDGQTCCLLLNGRYGCCPYPGAECCSDKLHCCPSGYTCDATGQFCNKGSLTVPSSAKLESTKLSVKENIVVCPNGAYCFDGQTCCLQRSGLYGCCPYAFAVCCWDNIHCCPYGYWCDSTGSKCFRGLDSIPSSNKLEAISPSVKEIRDNKIVCPDQTSQCQDGQTCCLLYNGTYGCCPYTWAVCCSDKIHCCPNSFRCDSTGHYCLKGDSTIVPSSVKLESTPLSPLQKKNNVLKSEEKAPMMKAIETKIIPCDNASYCENGQTCCKGPDKTYKCCPLEGASCCQDGINCCHNWCVPIINKCFPNVQKTYFPELEEESTTTLKAQKVTWCDAARTLYCHEGFECHMSDLTCKQKTKVSSLGYGLKAPRLSHICPAWAREELKHQCQHGETCCLVSKNENFIRCCPYKDGVCCNGGSYCCPSGSVCDDSKGMCKSISQEFWVGMTEMKAPRPTGEKPEGLSVVKDVYCGDNSSCPDGTTCCQQLDGHFTCCQFKNAVCCKDLKHCCPRGYKCDLASQSCTTDSPEDRVKVEMPWDLHARTMANRGSVQGGAAIECRRTSGDPTHSCSDGHKCCFGSSDEEEPVCCRNDGSACCDGFCCPSGHQCGTEKGVCLRAEVMP